MTHMLNRATQKNLNVEHRLLTTPIVLIPLPHGISTSRHLPEALRIVSQMAELPPALSYRLLLDSELC